MLDEESVFVIETRAFMIRGLGSIFRLLAKTHFHNINITIGFLLTEILLLAPHPVGQ